MNITEFMSFDLEWFTTLPGLLITGGVIVLLIALIIFIVSNKKTEKKKNVETPSVDNQTVPGTDSVNAENNTMTANDQTGLGSIPMDNSIPTNNVATMDFSAPINNGYVAGAINEMNATDTPVNNDVQSDNVFKANSINNIVTPATEEQKVVEPSFNTATPVVNNVVDFSAPVVPAVEQVIEPVVTPTVIPTVEPVVTPSVQINPTPMPEPVVTEAPVVQTTPIVEEKTTIYGGVNPVNTISNAPAVKPVIYGGANPLENTTTLPRMTSHEAYGASSNNATHAINETPVAPTIQVAEPVATSAVSEPVMPTVDTNTVPVPTVTPTMPMTGADMFGTTDTTDNTSSSSSEIETLEF